MGKIHFNFLNKQAKKYYVLEKASKRRFAGVLRQPTLGGIPIQAELDSYDILE